MTLSDTTLRAFSLYTGRFAAAIALWLLASVSSFAQANSTPQCPPGFAFTNGLCRGAPSVCPAGTTLQAGVCTGMPGCPAGAQVDAGLCTQAASCSAGFTFNRRSGACTTNPVCPGGATFNAEIGRCVEMAQCIPSIAGRRCSCPAGGEYRESGQMCIQGVPACPPGSVFDAASKACQ